MEFLFGVLAFTLFFVAVVYVAGAFLYWLFDVLGFYDD